MSRQRPRWTTRSLLLKPALIFGAMGCYALSDTSSNQLLGDDSCLCATCDDACTSDSWCSAWTEQNWRLWCRDNCERPKTLFAWHGKERTMVDGSEEEPLQSDRPDFTEASTAVGLHYVQLETGYTYTNDEEGQSLHQHSFPEALVRIGMFAEWFEFRIAANHGIANNFVGGAATSARGAEDLYLGCKFALTEQDGWLPEMVLLPQMTVPSGAQVFTTGEVMPGVNWLYGWDVTEKFSIAGSTQVNRSLDDSGVFYTEWAQSLTTGLSLTEKLGMYNEFFALFPHKAADALPEYYYDAGFTYLVHNNLQFDIRAGVGLNHAAADFFTGAGAVLRF